MESKPFVDLSTVLPPTWPTLDAALAAAIAPPAVRQKFRRGRLMRGEVAEPRPMVKDAAFHNRLRRRRKRLKMAKASIRQQRAAK